MEKSMREIIRYLFWGGVTFLVGTGCFFITAQLLQMNLFIANGISWLIAVAVAYYTNKKYVFHNVVKDRTAALKQNAQFLLARIVTLGVEEGILYLFVMVFLFPKMPIKIFAQVVVVVLNYLISKIIIFK